MNCSNRSMVGLGLRVSLCSCSASAQVRRIVYTSCNFVCASSNNFAFLVSRAAAGHPAATEKRCR